MSKRRKHVHFVLPMHTGMTVVVKGDPDMNPRTRAALTRICEAAVELLATTERKMGPIEAELWLKKDLSLAQLYHWNPSTRRYGCLSPHARVVLHDAATNITGMLIGPNEYWLPQIMSEALEAAAELEL